MVPGALRRTNQGGARVRRQVRLQEGAAVCQGRLLQVDGHQYLFEEKIAARQLWAVSVRNSLQQPAISFQLLPKLPFPLADRCLLKVFFPSPHLRILDFPADC